MTTTQKTWIALTVLGLIGAINGIRWIPFGVEWSMPHVAYHLDQRAVSMMTHMFLASVAIAIIPLQLLTRLRARRPQLHRVLGRVAVFAMIVGGITSVPLGLGMEIPGWGRAGYVVGSTMWTCAAILGAYFAMIGDIPRHRTWMIVTTALIYGAVGFRIQLPLLRAMGMDLDTGLAVVGWSCWAVNLVILAVIYRRAIFERFAPLPA